MEKMMTQEEHLGIGVPPPKLCLNYDLAVHLWKACSACMLSGFCYCTPSIRCSQYIVEPSMQGVGVIQVINWRQNTDTPTTLRLMYTQPGATSTLDWSAKRSATKSDPIFLGYEVSSRCGNMLLGLCWQCQCMELKNLNAFDANLILCNYTVLVLVYKLMVRPQYLSTYFPINIS